MLSIRSDDGWRGQKDSVWRSGGRKCKDTEAHYVDTGGDMWIPMFRHMKGNLGAYSWVMYGCRMEEIHVYIGLWKSSSRNIQLIILLTHYLLSDSDPPFVRSRRYTGKDQDSTGQGMRAKRKCIAWGCQFLAFSLLQCLDCKFTWQDARTGFGRSTWVPSNCRGCGRADTPVSPRECCPLCDIGLLRIWQWAKWSMKWVYRWGWDVEWVAEAIMT